ncbi:MAG: Non-canonical purine NTP pyrophosphatase [Methanoregula sp. PtaU1.Bin006]|nr:MAG: Non-canonical purine NTP pyrophosphatase [Methanoregula sp. PtaB.Bin085]OPY33974.1 MAG: Non-canonical purine NTP pyrophosphatase [Methanoregula sp. PtaU1.Bin006]
MVTGNAGKAAEVAAFFGGLLEVDHIALEVPEHRSSDVADIARGKAEYAYRQLKIPLIVDDTGFFIDALGGFPGPYAAYVLDTIGNAGILRLMEGVSDRKARFITGIAYADTNGIEVFTGTLEGKISFGPRGENGFGYDPIFEIGTMTLAEISLDEKSRISHRGRALSLFHDWFVSARSPG